MNFIGKLLAIFWYLNQIGKAQKYFSDLFRRLKEAL